ncbi:PEP/pyruvate-binding domain-containing protein [Amycolatopsis thermophila]|uniref:PEP/pyruvate-binding domain-containing protein n=1 Tax=Amycolatopsis thermophila TaxID=206084 RepID=UPI0027D77E2B|nr:PEP/pyruvate-binding domain-containing protein [Amycolatopsis thermophila]
MRCTDVNLPVAVRSSATGEDGSHASFAGIFDTYLGVTGPQAVIESVRNCWGSLFTARALATGIATGSRTTPMPAVRASDSIGCRTGLSRFWAGCGVRLR